MDELTIEGKKYLSSRQAAKVTGYAKDYVGQLCREGRVEARLVGRNWYVLEESILEHRFGAEDAPKQPETEEQNVVSTWDTPVYKPEVASQVPEFAPKAVSEAPNVTKVPASNPAVLADMQSAWQDWFAEKPIEPKEPEEALLEEHYDHTGEETTPTEAVTIERIHEEEPQREEASAELPVYEPVVITRHREPEPVEVAPLRTRAEFNDYRAAPLRTKAIRGQGKRRKGSRAVLQSTFIALAVLAIAVTVIGSGAADAYLNKKTLISPVTDRIAGITVIEANK